MAYSDLEEVPGVVRHNTQQRKVMLKLKRTARL